jgi:hypothetical protein
MLHLLLLLLLLPLLLLHRTNVSCLLLAAPASCYPVEARSPGS